MLIEFEGVSLWYGTPETSAPEGDVQSGVEIPITIGVRPANASNRIEVLYRRNGGPIEQLSTRWWANDPLDGAQYFCARFPALNAGDRVEYTPVCICASRRVPCLKDPIEWLSSFSAKAEGRENSVPAGTELPPMAREAASEPPIGVAPLPSTEDSKERLEVVSSVAKTEPPLGQPLTGVMASGPAAVPAPAEGRPIAPKGVAEPRRGAPPFLSAKGPKERLEVVSNIAKTEATLAQPLARVATSESAPVVARAGVRLTAPKAVADPSTGAPPLLSTKGMRELRGALGDVARNEPTVAQPVVEATIAGAAPLVATSMAERGATEAELTRRAEAAVVTVARGSESLHELEHRSPPDFTKMPPPLLLTIKGIFSIYTFDKDVQISQRDFQFYDVSAEVSGLPGDRCQVLHYAFPADVKMSCYAHQTIQSTEGDLTTESLLRKNYKPISTEDRPLPTCDAIQDAVEVQCPVSDGNGAKRLYLTEIQFPDTPTIPQGVPTISVRVIVKSFDGTILWSREYRPDDPMLGALCIEVPLQRPIALIRSTTPTISDLPHPNKEKKLRGQVLELTTKCALKNLTVVIQAKAEADKLWKIVGAGTTDSAGNFSIPYPFGVFAEAQALVSLTPNSPATVKVTDVRNGNETIAEDFLYLLLKDIDCPPAEAERDCDCHGKKRTARLPDHADLIESDEYTQDIGGSCVNLSTPNRTLSEFNYQAIVRTSDPDVANYALQKCEGLKETGIDAVHLLEISRALSALDSGLKNQTLQNGLPPAALSAASTQTIALRTHIEQASDESATPNVKAEAVTAAIKDVDLLISGLIASLTQSNADTVAPGSTDSGPAQGGSVSATKIEDEIKRVLVSLDSSAGWDRFEGAIRQAVINAGGAPLTPTFFFQFGGWGGATTQVLFLGGAALSYGFSDLLTQVCQEAAKAGATGAFAPSGAIVPAVPIDTLNAGSYVVVLANDLKAYLNAAQLLRWETCYLLVGGAKKRQRERVDLDNVVAWQDDDQHLTLYQAVTVATGHILHYKSEFKADGYSLGDLIYSLPLAPGQKKEIVIFDASHRLMGMESQTLSQGERLAAGIVDERTIISGLGGHIGESMRGASSATTRGISAGFGTGGQGSGSAGSGGAGYGGSGSAVIGVAGGVANANSSAWQDSSRDISEFFGETLRQSITQNANDYRELNASVVTTVEEGQQYGVTSEVVANHNHCHALTMMYFEVLRHYAIFQRLSSAEECVFVPLLMTNFIARNIYKWRDVLARFLLPMPADTYLQSLSSSTPSSPQQHPLLRAFDANERILTNYANVDYPVGSYDDESIQFIRGNIRIRVKLPRPRTRYDRIMSLPVTKQIDAQALSDAVQKFSQDGASYAAKAAFTAGIWTAFEKPPTPPDPMQYQVLATEAISDAFMSMDANFQSVPPAQCMRITNFKPQPVSFGGGQFTLNPILGLTALDFFAENLDDRKQWRAYADILGYSDVETMLNAHFKGNLISEWDSIFYTDIAPLVFEKIVSRISLSEFSTDFSSETNYEGGERAMRLNLTGTTSKKRNQLPLELTLAINDQNFKKLKEYITFNVEDLTISYSTAHYRGVLYAGNVNDDLFDDTALYIPESPDEKRNLRKEDAYLVYKLIEHLNGNIEYYNKTVWYNLDPDRRYMLLDGFDIQTFNDFGLPIGRRSLASVVKNELVTITGNSLVLPVAAGYRVSQSYLVEQSGDGAEVVSLLDHYQPVTPIQPYRISVPTRGVFAEAVQGACNACEKIETDRLQDWNRFPNTDEPTAISPVTPPTPVVTDWKAAFKDFATPMVNIQNAPAAPAPGAGLAGLSDLLGKAGIFKDITGLEGNQQNVIRTYLSNQENAKAFGEMAKEMAMQQHNTQNSGKIMDQITAAKQSGDITKQEAGQLVKDHLQTQIDGGATKKAQLDKTTQEALPSVAQAGVNAINRGRGDVATTVSHPDGFMESVTVKNATTVDQGTEPLPGDLAAEQDWARLHPVPEFTQEDMLLSLWNYPVGKADLAPEHRAALDQFLKEALQAAKLGGSAVPSKTEIYITGHASNTGEKAANETLSRQRAENVASYLLSRGITQQQMRVDWASASDPADPGDSGFAAARNRRVDVLKYTPSETGEEPPADTAEPTPSDGDVPGAPGPVVPETFEDVLLLIKGGLSALEVTEILSNLVLSEEALLPLEAAGTAAGLFGGLLTFVSVMAAFVNADNEGLRGDKTMGFVYGVMWAIDHDDFDKSGEKGPPPPTGADYNPTGVGDPWDKRREYFDQGVQTGIKMITPSSRVEEEGERSEGEAKLLAGFVAAKRKFPGDDKAAHKYFVTQLYRACYRDEGFLGTGFHLWNVSLDRDKWSLDWPDMGVLSIGP